MTKPSIAARCESCSKSYRVPDAARAYKCKACGGPLLVDEPESEQSPKAELDDGRECPACHALNFGPAAHCAECGAALNRGGARRSQAERVARHEASSEFARASKLLNLLRLLFLWHFAFNLVVVVVGSFALLDPSVSAGPLFLGLAIFAVSAALNLAGAMLIRHQPLLWSLLSAALTTLTAALRVHEYYTEDKHRFLLTIVMGGSVAWVLLMWWIVFAASKVQRLRRRHPDLYAAHLLTGTVAPRARAGSSAESENERSTRIQDHARRRAVRSAVISAGTVLGLSVLLAGGVYAGMRPAPLAEASARFCEAWQARDIDAIAQMCVKPSQEEVRGALQRLVAVRGWTRAWPTIQDIEPDAAQGSAIGGATEYELSGDEQVTVRWRLASSAWKIEGLTLPGPSAQARIEEFVRAWKSGELAEVLALYPEPLREERTRGVERVLERLGWPANKGTISVRRAYPSRHDRVEVTFEVDSGQTLDARFELDSDFVWWLDGLKTSAR